MAQDRTQKRIDHKREITGVFYIAVAVLLAVAFYSPGSRSGMIGHFLLMAGKGLVGSAALALPAIFFYMAIDYLLEKQIRRSRLRFTCVLLFLVGLAALLHLLTVDQSVLQSLSLDADRLPKAGKAIALLWNSGGNPALLASGKTPLAGGILGGGLAQAMLGLAGSVGAIVIVAALLLSMLILILNISLSRAVGQTAKAIRQTGQRVDQAVRSSVASLKEARGTGQDPASYDLLLDKDTAAPPAAETAGPHKVTLLESIRRLWQPAEPAAAQPAADLSVPEFLRQDRPQTDQEIKAGKARSGASGAAPIAAATAAKTAGPATAEPQAAVMTQKSPFDLRIEGKPAARTDDAAHQRHEDAAAQPVAFPMQPDKPHPAVPGEIETPLPAGVHRVGDTAGWPFTTPEDHAAPEHPPGGPAVGHAVEAGTADDLAEGSRAHWIDRAAGGPGNVYSALPGRHIRGGDQLTLPYQKPPLQLLKEDVNTAARGSNSVAVQTLGRKLEDTLESFGIQATVVHVTTGPTITRFELSPGPGVKVSRIVSLADDIALNLAAMGVRIEAPIPGKAAIGIEIPNKETTPVLLRGLLESQDYQRSPSPLTAALGRDIQGSPILCDIAKMPHLLIAGATGSGKSVCINAILMSILYRASPEDVKMLMIDPKVVELSAYNGIPHLLLPVVTDTKKAANALIWAVNEMVRRYGLFAEKSVRDISAYQAAYQRGEEDFERLPLILLVIDELADLMQTTPTEVEDAIARLTAMARAAGIHLIIATQRPSVDVITGVIKANIPSRIAFAVASQVDSRTILDMAGAEKLLGKGDMLYYPQSAAKPVRGQGAFVMDAEVEQVLSFIKSQHPSEYDPNLSEAILSAPMGTGRERDSGDQDELLPQAVGIVVEAGYASVSLLQRRMNVGYPRAARLIDRMQEMGYVGPFEGSKPRKVLISQAQFLEMKAREEI
jgi:DNA segregation ATPase FtsK/SpoIIIE-like protein